jgi:hypothetical protein
MLSSRRGFSLAETVGVIIGCGVLAVGILGYMGSYFHQMAQPFTTINSPAANTTYSLAPDTAQLDSALQLHQQLLANLTSADLVMVYGGTASSPAPSAPSPLLASYAPSTLSSLAATPAWESDNLLAVSPTLSAEADSSVAAASNYTVVTLVGANTVTSVTNVRVYTQTVNGNSYNFHYVSLTENGPQVAFLGGGGSGATGSLTVANGNITGVTILTQGYGYPSTCTVLVSGGGGTGAYITASATGGHVTGTTIYSGGSNYASSAGTTYTYTYYLLTSEDAFGLSPTSQHFMLRNDTSWWARTEDGLYNLVFPDPYSLAANSGAAETDTMSRFTYATFAVH